MSVVVFQQLQAIVRRHLWLLFPGLTLSCSGCISCTGHRMTSHIQDVRIQLSPEQFEKLKQYDTTQHRIPNDRCFEICKTAAGMSWRRPDMCSLMLPQSADPQVNVSPDSNQLVCRYHISEVMAAGRRPSGLQPHRAIDREPTAAWLADAARLEAAAVIAFRELHDELSQIDAPMALRAACILAISDERRHADTMRQLARAAGREPASPIIKPSPPRSIFALARDNAVEGCVRESFGALEATWQSQTASHPAIRSAMAQIAQDEARHAELAFALNTWLQDRLTPAEREQISAAQRDACQQIWRELGARLSTTPALGLPDGALGQALFHEMMSALCPQVRLV